MDKSITASYEYVYQQNLVLLEMAKQGEWQNFIELAADYVVTLQNILDGQADNLSAFEKEQLKAILQNLIDNETIIIRALQGRLDVLRRDMSTLNLGRKCNQAYASSFTSTLQ